MLRIPRLGLLSGVLWVSQLNITYSPLTNISSRNGMNYGQTIQPDVSTYEGDPAINGMFCAISMKKVTFADPNNRKLCSSL